MNLTKTQKILLVLAAFNLAIVFLFPPFDDYSVTNNDAAIFAGFLFVFNKSSNLLINASLLYLEVAVVLINLGILWLLTTENARRVDKKKFNFRKAAMILIAANLVGVLLFPPFEYISNMTLAVIPTFEGFYFIFSHPPYRVIVTPILYIEVFFVLINGSLMLLAFKEEGEAPGAEQAMAYMAKLQAEKKAKADNIPKVDMMKLVVNKKGAETKVMVKKKSAEQKKPAAKKKLVAQKKTALSK